MAFADPQTVTINAVAKTLPRISYSPSVYSQDDGNIKVTVQHAAGKARTRRTVRLDFAKVAADPLIAAQNIRFSMSAYLVVDQPITGFTVAELKQVVDGLTLWLTASSGANTTKFLGGEV